MKDSNSSSSLVKKVSLELDSLRARGSASVPPLCRGVIRSLPGNACCVDCGAANPEWVSLTYGSLICMTCSGRHRSYGVGVSVVRSLSMDDMTVSQVLSLLEGGNDQLQAFFDRHHMGRTSGLVTTRYHTKAALFYRTHLSKHVTSVDKQGAYQGREASRKRYQKDGCSSSSSCSTNHQHPTQSASSCAQENKRRVPSARRAIPAQ